MRYQAAIAPMAAIALLWFVCPACALSFHSTLDSIKVYPRPGDVVNHTFELTLAKEERPCHFLAHIQDWWVSEDGRQSFYREPGSTEAPKRSCAAWVKLKPVETAVEPGGTLAVKVTVTVPREVKPGGYWCALTVDELPDPLTSPHGVAMRLYASISVGIFVFLEPLERKASITGVQLFPDRAEIKVRNDGNCPLGVDGRLEFLKPGAKDPTDVVIIPRAPLLPEPINTTTLIVPLHDEQALPSGDYLVRALLDIGTDHYLGVQKEMLVSRETKAASSTP